LQDGRYLAGAPQGKGEAVPATATFQVIQVEIDQIPAQDQVGIEFGKTLQKGLQQRSLIRLPVDRQAAPPVRGNPLHQHLLPALTAEGDGEHLAVDAIGLDVQAEVTGSGLELAGFHPGRDHLQIAVAFDRLPPQGERGGNETLHEKTVRWLDIRLVEHDAVAGG